MYFFFSNIFRGFLVLFFNISQYFKDDERLVQLTEGAANLAKSVSPPPVASGNVHTSGGEEDSDVESLHSYHYSPKAVDIPSAVRLAKRLYTLDGFKKSDVSRHLSKKYVSFKRNYIFIS